MPLREGVEVIAAERDTRCVAVPVEKYFSRESKTAKQRAVALFFGFKAKYCRRTNFHTMQR